ncbi:MAG: nucleotidyltransferase family protein [Desulfobacteraceae bacterium]|nr:nucleotidyltransferase family protein [Desulfobacteraceae bacterium]
MITEALRKNFTASRVQPDISIKKALEYLDQSGTGILILCEADDTLAGVVTDGNVRRAMLKGVDFNNEIRSICTTNPVVGHYPISRAKALEIMDRSREFTVNHLPLVDDSNKVIGLLLRTDLNRYEDFRAYPNPIVLMAGGIGSRLRPLTQECPKPMLKVGGKPILETIIENFVEQGFFRFYLAVNYKSHIIEDHFGDGKAFGAQITYLREKERMGTAGALSLLPARPEVSFIVMNGDLLTKVNFPQLIDFHRENRAEATMCVRQYDMQVPYGVVKVQGQRVLSLEEKPLHSFFVNAGIYVLEPDALDYTPHNTFHDMTDLFHTLVQKGHSTAAFPIREYWIDVGRMSDYERANGEFCQYFVWKNE